MTTGDPAMDTLIGVGITILILIVIVATWPNDNLF